MEINYHIPDLPDGSSGSWVVDPFTGDVYGHIVANDPFGDVYVVPLADTFNEIRKAYGAKEVRIASELDLESTGSSAPPREAPNEFSTAKLPVVETEMSKPMRKSKKSKEPEPKQTQSTVSSNTGPNEKTNPKLVNAKAIFEYVWYCCGCSDGPYSCKLESGCSNCNRWRCGNCRVERRIPPR
jgi:hypothetical protein